jgi:hypothetical protein
MLEEVLFVCAKLLFATAAPTLLSFIATRDLPGMTLRLRHATPFLFTTSHAYRRSGDYTRSLVGWYFQAKLRFSVRVTSVV